MLRVAHILTGTDRGGAEQTLYRLLVSADPCEFRSVVLSLGSVGPVGRQIQELGVPVIALDLKNPSSWFKGLINLFVALRTVRPHVVQTWMYHADLVGGLVSRVAGVRNVVWGLRQGGSPSGRAVKTTTAFARAICARLSSVVPVRIVSCSYAICLAEAERGYSPDRMIVIPNGFFVPELDRVSRERARTELGIERDCVVISRVARVHPDKDYGTFISASKVIAERYPQAEFVMCGLDVEWDNAWLRSALQAAGMTDRVTLLGERGDVEKVHAATDIGCSSSLREGFPNVVGECMAAGVPVVATDVGDSGWLLGGGGTIVPKASPGAMADALAFFIESGPENRKRVGECGRQRIRSHFSVERMAAQYGELYRELGFKQ